jgi:hypothetical protein
MVGRSADQIYPNAVIHDARAGSSEGFAAAFNGDEQVGFFDPEKGGTVEEPA